MSLIARRTKWGSEMTEPILRGSKAIARALGCSASTVKRLAAKGRLPTFKLGNKTSPLSIKRADLARMRGSEMEA